MIEVHLLQLGHFYEQKECAAMGSPISAVVANLYMEFFEELALETTLTRHRLWKRYVDDTFCILRKGSTEELLHHFNGVRLTSTSLWSRKNMGHSRPSICYSGGERMAAWTVLSTGSPHTRTSISTSSPII